MPNLSSIESLVSARNARRREYKRSALLEMSRRIDAHDVAGIALSLGIAELWEDCYERAAEITG